MRDRASTSMWGIGSVGEGETTGAYVCWSASENVG